MKKPTKEDLVKYRIERAKETLASSIILIKHDITGNSVANRLYYASFYGVMALLINKDIEYKSHKSVKTALSNFYIKTNLIESSFASMYNKLFDMRQQGDYTDFVDIKIETIKPYIERVEQFIEIIEKLLAEA